MQTVGLLTEHNEAVTRGDPGTRSISLLNLKRGHVVALDCVNMTKDYVATQARDRPVGSTGFRLADADAP